MFADIDKISQVSSSILLVEHLHAEYGANYMKLWAKFEK